MSPLYNFSRDIYKRMPQGIGERLKPVGLALLSLLNLKEFFLSSRAFRHIYGVKPSSKHSRVLAHLARTGHRLSFHQRERRVLAAFDQQDLSTGYSIRWDTTDLKVMEIEGLRMHLDLADFAVSDPLSRGIYEHHLMAFYRRNLRAGMCVVDAGANIGLYSLLAAQLVGPEGKVWSFEPNSENCRLLLATLLDNNLDNVALQPVALGSSRGYTFFSSGLGSNGGLVSQAKQSLTHPSCKVVPVAKLDDFAIPRVDLMKMDVEGAEGLILMGALETIDRCRPIITAEFSCEMLPRVSGMPGADFLRFFLQRDYEIFMLDKSTAEEIPVLDPDAFTAGFGSSGRIEDMVMYPVNRRGV